MNFITEYQAPQVFIAELQPMRQWVAWRYRDRGDGKPTKQPVDPVTGRSADVSDPSTWGTFFEALGTPG